MKEIIKTKIGINMSYPNLFFYQRIQNESERYIGKFITTDKD